MGFRRPIKIVSSFNWGHWGHRSLDLIDKCPHELIEQLDFILIAKPRARAGIEPRAEVLIPKNRKPQGTNPGAGCFMASCPRQMGDIMIKVKTKRRVKI